MKKQIIFAILATALTATAFTGCGRKQSTDAVDVVYSETGNSDIELAAEVQATVDTLLPTATQRPVVTETAAPDPGAAEVKTSEEKETTTKPVATDAKESEAVATPKSTETEGAKSAEAVTPKPSETEAPKSVETVTTKPSETEKSESAETAAQKPTEAEAPKSAETETPKPTETEAPKPAETATPKPAETEAPKPAETATPKPVETPIPTTAPTSTPTAAPCNHNYVKSYLPSAPTCSHGANYAMICSICGDVGDTGSDSALDHTPVTSTEVDATYCNEQGIRVTTCSVCGAELSREGFDGSEHDWVTGQGDPYWSEEALDFITDEVTYCSRCGAQK